VHQAFGLHEPRPGAGLPGRPSKTTFRRRPADLVESSGRDLSAVTQHLAGMEDIAVSDVLLSTDQGRITIFGLPDAPGSISHVFQAVASGGIVVDMIVHNLTGPGRAELSFSVPRADLPRALALTEAAVRGLDREVRVAGDGDIAKLFVLGVGMRTHTGVARRMFGALAERGINIGLINTSEVRLSAVVDRDRGEEALVALKRTFNVP
jgi:aspartate kinase